MVWRATRSQGRKCWTKDCHIRGQLCRPQRQSRITWCSLEDQHWTTLFSTLRHRSCSACWRFRHLKNQRRMDPIVGGREDAHDKKATGRTPCVKPGLGQESWRTRANASSWNSPPHPYARWTGCATVAAWRSLWFVVAWHLMSVIDGTNRNWRRNCNKLFANIASTTMALPFQLGFESCSQVHYYILRCFGYYESVLILRIQN